MFIAIEERARKLISCSFIQNVGEQNQISKYYQNESEWIDKMSQMFYSIEAVLYLFNLFVKKMGEINSKHITFDLIDFNDFN